MLDAVRAVLDGETPLDPGEALRVLNVLAREEGPREKPPSGYPPESLKEPLKNTLSSQETEVLRLIALGKTNRQIAQELIVSLSSVKGRPVEDLQQRSGCACVRFLKAAARRSGLSLILMHPSAWKRPSEKVAYRRVKPLRPSSGSPPAPRASRASACRF